MSKFDEIKLQFKILLKAKFNNPFQVEQVLRKKNKYAPKKFKKREGLVFLMMALLIEVRSPPLLKVKKNVLLRA